MLRARPPQAEGAIIHGHAGMMAISRMGRRGLPYTAERYCFMEFFAIYASGRRSSHFTSAAAARATVTSIYAYDS